MGFLFRSDIFDYIITPLTGLYFISSNGEDTFMFSPSFYVDVSGLESVRRKAYFAHASKSPDKF